MQVLEESGPESRSNCGQALSRNGTDICQSPVKLGRFRIKQPMKCSSYNKQMIPKLRMWFIEISRIPFKHHGLIGQRGHLNPRCDWTKCILHKY